MTKPRITVTKLSIQWPSIFPVRIRPRALVLPFRYWRWLWLAMAVRLLVSVPVILVLGVPYEVCRLYIWAADQLGGFLGNIPVKSYNRDLANSGWKLPVRRAPAPRISAEWEARLRGPGGDDGDVRGVSAEDMPAGEQ